MGGRDDLKVFAGRASRDIAERICRRLDIPLGQGRTDLFPDGEVIVKLEEDVRGRDCFIVQSTYHPVNAHLMELLIYIDCLRRASARRITAVIPYFGYARQDRKDEGRVPITAKLVANLITVSGADRVLTIDLHAAQLQGFFDIPLDHLFASPVLCDYFVKKAVADLVVVSPDVGGIKMARAYAKMLNAGLAVVDKKRLNEAEVATGYVIGEVKGKNVLILDDIISTAGTVCEAARVLKEHGAKDIYIAATHPVFCGPAHERLSAAPIKELSLIHI